MAPFELCHERALWGKAGGEEVAALTSARFAHLGVSGVSFLWFSAEERAMFLRLVNDKQPPPDLLIGQLVSDRYRIHHRIGEGGMGTVYEAFHEAIEKKIALKVLHREYSSSPEVVERFKQEAISASRIKHQNVIDVFDFGQLNDGSCFIAMEYLDGMDLGDALQAKGPLAADHAIRIAVQICRALGLAHNRGVVHRDMKPENVFLQRTPEGDEVVKIVDFGIAQLRKNDSPGEPQERQRRLTKTGMIFGTPEYMAPEQAKGLDVDQRSDVYAVGIIVYEMLTGAVPFLGESFLEVLNKHTMAAVPPFSEANAHVEISRELEGVVMKSLQKEADDRFPSMKELSRALLRTPEGRAVRSRISSMSSIPDVGEEDYPIEDLPRPVSVGPGTAVFGSPGVESEAQEKSSKGLIFGLSAAILLVLGVGGYVGLAGSDSPAPDSSASDSSAPDPSETNTEDGRDAGSLEPVDNEAAAENSASAVEAEEAPDVAEEAKDTAELSIITDPEGAIVEKDGFQVCDATPCTISAKIDVGITLSAHKARLKGEVKVLPQRDQKVTIELKAPKIVRPRPKPTPKPAAPAMCEVMVDGLKILRPCQ